MSMRGIAAAFAASVAMAGCAEEAAAPAGNQASAEAAGSKASGAVADSPEVLANTTVTASDQPLKVPPAPVELLVTQVSLSSTGTIPRHKHPWSRYVYLQSGTLRVTNYDAETVNTYNAPQIIVESIDQWHDAMVVANAPVQMIVVDQVPPGQSNVIFPPPSR